MRKTVSPIATFKIIVLCNIVSYSFDTKANLYTLILWHNIQP